MSLARFKKPGGALWLEVNRVTINLEDRIIPLELFERLERLELHRPANNTADGTMSTI